MKRLILHGTLVNDANKFDGSVIVEDSKITKIVDGNAVPNASFDEVIDASGCFVLPGLIDDHVHFREPGLTAKADIDSESRAAAAGGVTTYFDMPNCVPQTTTLEALDEKFKLAAQKSHVNYSFFFGATNDNVDLFSQLDVHRIPGIKLFMGSSTGNMLVDRREALEKIFSTAQMPIMVHCEDTDIINRNMAEAKRLYGDDPKVTHHPEIRSVEACYQSTKLAVELALKHHAHLHIAHLTTAKELELIPHTPHPSPITCEVTPSHLYFCDRDYKLQFSLVTMLELVDKGVLTIERLVELMCHRPADLFGVRNRGYLREGYQADIVIVRPNAAWTVTKDIIQSKCGWSPMENHTYLWRVEQTLCNGHTVYKDGVVDTNYIGQPVQFR